MIKKLTPRSKIRINWTTNPADLGYGGKTTDWQDPRHGEIVGMRQAINYAYDEIQRRVGTGTYYAVAYFHGDREVTIDEIRAAIED